MGLIKWAEKKVKDRFTPDSQVKASREQQAARRRAEDIQLKQELHEERMKGQRVGLKKQAYNQGLRSAQGGNRGGITGALQGLEYGINSTEKSFGFGSKGGSMGMGDNFFGLPGFGSSEPKKQVPQRVTTVNPRTGKVTITEPATRAEAMRKKKPVNPYEWEVHNFFEDQF